MFSTLTFISLLAGAQNIKGKLVVDFNDIKETMTTDRSSYDDQLQLFLKDDEMMRIDDYALLYYGQSFLPQYNGGTDANEVAMKTFVNESNYAKIYELGTKILKYNPVCINALFNIWQAAIKLGKPQAEIDSYQHKYWSLLYVISQSGDGKSCGTAFKVICPNDQYYLMYSYLGIDKIFSHDLDMEHLCNIFKVTPCKNFDRQLLYIDISRYLLETAKEIKK